MNSPVRDKISWVLAGILGVTFIGAAVTKFNYNVPLEKEMLSYFGMLKDGWTPVVAILARLLIVSELALGLALLQPYWRKRVILPACLLMLVGFSIYLVGLSEQIDNCGCFGSWIKMNPKESILKNIILFIIGTGAFLLSPKDPKGKVIIPALLVVASTAVVFAMVPVQRIQFGPEKQDFSHLGSFKNEIRPLADGLALLCFFNATCEHCEEAGDIMAGLNDPGVPVYFAFHGDDAEITAYRENIGVEELPWKMLSINDFFSKVGKAPPRVYLLKNGQSVAYWDNAPDVITIRSAIKTLKQD